MKFQLTIDVRMTQEGHYNNGLHLGDNYMLELHTLSDAAEILVKFHDLANSLLSKQIAHER